MNIVSAYPLVTTSNLAASRDFYVGNFGFDVIFEASWVVVLGNGHTGDVRLGFMSPDHPTSPPGPEEFEGRGMIVTIQVEDAQKALAALREKGAPIAYDLHDEPWGQRRFMTVDPSGTLVDVVEQTEAAKGYWEEYLPRENAASV